MGVDRLTSMMLDFGTGQPSAPAARRWCRIQRMQIFGTTRAASRSRSRSTLRPTGPAGSSLDSGARPLRRRHRDDRRSRPATSTRSRAIVFSKAILDRRGRARAARGRRAEHGLHRRGGPIGDERPLGGGELSPIVEWRMPIVDWDCGVGIGDGWGSSQRSIDDLTFRDPQSTITNESALSNRQSQSAIHNQRSAMIYLGLDSSTQSVTATAIDVDDGGRRTILFERSFRTTRRCRSTARATACCRRRIRRSCTRRR